MVESRQHEVLAIVCVFTVVPFLFVASRVGSRYLGRNFGWDDYLIMIAMVLLLADTVGIWRYIILSGTGYHIWDVPKTTVAEQLVALHWNFAVQMFYHPREQVSLPTDVKEMLTLLFSHGIYSSLDNHVLVPDEGLPTSHTLLTTHRLLAQHLLHHRDVPSQHLAVRPSALCMVQTLHGHG